MEALARLEYSTLTQAQRLRHGSPEANPEEEEISSHFYDTPQPKCGWSTRLPVMCLGSSSDKGQTVMYNLPFRAHRLMYTFMTQRLPALTVKPAFAGEYQIRWPRNSGHHIIRSGALYDASIQLQTINATFLDYWEQLYNQKTRNSDRALGNVRKLTEWNTRLPEYTVAAFHPWFYSLRTKDAIPVDAEHVDGELQHIYKVRSTISELLQMQRFDKRRNQWVNIKPDLRVLRGIPDGEGKLDTPKLWASLAHRSELEVAMTRGTNNGKPDVYIEYLDLIYEEHPTTQFTYGDSAQFATMPNAPCEAIFVGAQRVDPKRLELFSNYTTSNEDSWWLPDEGGENPIEAMSVYYNSYRRLESYPAICLGSTEIRKHFPNDPVEQGYNAYALAIKPGTREDRQTGIALQSLQTRIIVKLVSGNSGYLLDDLDGGEDEPLPAPEEEAPAEEETRSSKGKGRRPVRVRPLTQPDEKVEEVPPTFKVFLLFLVQRQVSYVYDASLRRYVVSVTCPPSSPSAPALTAAPLAAQQRFYPPPAATAPTPVAAAVRPPAGVPATPSATPMGQAVRPAPPATR